MKVQQDPAVGALGHFREETPILELASHRRQIVDASLERHWIPERPRIAFDVSSGDACCRGCLRRRQQETALHEAPVMPHAIEAQMLADPGRLESTRHAFQEWDVLGRVVNGSTKGLTDAVQQLRLREGSEL